MRMKLEIKKEEHIVAFLSTIFFGFLGVCAIVACVRSGKLLIKGINRLFDKIDNKFIH